MRHLTLFGIVCLLCIGAVPVQDYPVVPVPFTDVTVAPGLWLNRIETNRTVTIPFAFRKCEETGRIDNFAVAGKLKQGTFRGLRYDDSDVYKIIEGASYTLAIHPDRELDQYLDGVIAKIAAAQEQDGYLYTMRTIKGKDVPKNVGTERWSNLKDSHELYNVGHMYEAAVAHYLATGKRSLLDVAIKNANMLVNTFGLEELIAVPGHQEVEIGLVKLYRVTGNQDYLRLAQFFLDYRGRGDKRTLYTYDWLKPPFDSFYSQDFAPVTEQREAVGHAVRAGYMYAGMADVAALTGSKAYLGALETIWSDVVCRKLYLTGGVGASDSGENYGVAYDLPNRDAYAETCAAIALILWNQRMFLLTGHAKYLDVLERALYNGFLSGVSLSGDRFFYPNPLASDGKTGFNENCSTRVPWFECSCCPSNICRFLPSIPGYVYARRGEDIYVNQFLPGTGTIKTGRGAVRITQSGDYPWDGDVKLTVSPDEACRFALRVRIPGWARDEAVPCDLYRFAAPSTDAVTLRVNDQAIKVEEVDGFAVLDRTWQAGDTVRLHLPMPARAVYANEKVEADRGKVAFERGPLVYCAEGVDNGGRVLDLVVPAVQPYRAELKKDLLGGIVVLHGNAARSAKPFAVETITLVPYFAWSNRGEGEMAVWFDAAPGKPGAAM